MAQFDVYSTSVQNMMTSFMQTVMVLRPVLKWQLSKERNIPSLLRIAGLKVWKDYKL